MTKDFALLAEYQHQLASLATPTPIWFLYSSFLQDSTAFSTTESCCSHLVCPSCCDGNLLVDQKFIEQENLIK